MATEGDRVLSTDRARLNGHRGGILWFTGLSGAGKTTLAVALEQALFALGLQVYLLDGDNLRQGLSRDLGFSPAHRTENIRRTGEVAALFADAGMIVIAALISPYRGDRDRLRATYGDYFREIYINAPLEVCERRDTKGLYRRARAGEIHDFTGLSAPYEPPLAPHLEIPTGQWPVTRCVTALTTFAVKAFSVSNGGEG